MEKVLQELSNIVSEFLEEEGGLSNGYLTYAKGSVGKSYIQPIKWSTPIKDELTVKEIKRKGYELNNRVIKCLKSYSMEECKIEKKHLEYGCFDTIVTLSFSKKVSLA